ncbi:hypothetical protein JYU34_000529 [Plutella xylostella]|uniref:Secreted protein n=1 Tax=Plutella xylostella TaxID=51655 RepID=A0ABQ7R7Y4_PLUXY|nr:hypothetical protein JYU34_000529 [Plutella xylostella]
MSPAASLCYSAAVALLLRCRGTATLLPSLCHSAAVALPLRCRSADLLRNRCFTTPLLSPS